MMNYNEKSCTICYPMNFLERVRKIANISVGIGGLTAEICTTDPQMRRKFHNLRKILIQQESTNNHFSCSQADSVNDNRLKFSFSSDFKAKNRVFFLCWPHSLQEKQAYVGLYTSTHKHRFKDFSLSYFLEACIQRVLVAEFQQNHALNFVQLFGMYCSHYLQPPDLFTLKMATVV